MKNFSIKSEEKRLVFAEVYSPLHVDTDGETMTADEIEKMAYRFLAKGNVSKIDVGHNRKESGCYIVESFLVRKNDPDNFIEGSWVLGVKIEDPEIWAQIKSGELNGFSFDGSVVKTEGRAKVSVMRSMVGKTEESLDGGLLPPHVHDISLEFTEEGKLIPSYTGEALGHKHVIEKGTSTEREFEHSHRIILME